MFWNRTPAIQSAQNQLGQGQAQANNAAMQNAYQGFAYGNNLQSLAVNVANQLPSTLPQATLKTLVASTYNGRNTFPTFRKHKMPELQERGYCHFLVCKTVDFIDHQEWCRDNCQDYTIGFCNQFEIATEYVLCFASKADAAYFRCSWDADVLVGEEE